MAVRRWRGPADLVHEARHWSVTVRLEARTSGAGVSWGGEILSGLTPAEAQRELLGKELDLVIGKRTGKVMVEGDGSTLRGFGPDGPPFDYEVADS